jgi:quinol monooxygenase YgiN
VDGHGIRDLERVQPVSDVGYIVVDVWRAKPGMRDQVDAVLKDAAVRFRAIEGVLSVDYARLDNHDDMYLVVFRYTDAGARERFSESDDLRSTMTHLRQLWDLESPIYRGASTGF